MNIKKNTVIPKKCKVGFGYDINVEQLAYITYYINDKLRKQKSFYNWIDKKKETFDINNEPTNGFKILEDSSVGRYMTNLKYTRILDPRGFIFEINLGNLLSIIADTNIKNGIIQDKCVYAYNNGNLLLIPISSKYYKDIKKYSIARLDKKQINKNNIIIGNTYLSKNGDKLVFLGHLKTLNKYCDYISKNTYYNIDTNKIITRQGYSSFIQDLDKFDKFNILMYKFNNSIFNRKIKDIKLVKEDYNIALSAEIRKHYVTKDLILVTFNYYNNIIFTKLKLKAMGQLKITNNDNYLTITRKNNRDEIIKTKDIFNLLLIMDNNKEINYYNLFQEFDLPILENINQMS